MTLHYILDPLCGWCYAVAPLIQAAHESLPVAFHAGGMMAGSNRRTVTPQLRRMVDQHDRRIAQLSGQPFGEAYRDDLLRDESAVFDSEPPITAMLAADECAGRGLDLLARMQTAHYVEGRRIADPAVLRALALDIGLDGPAFDAAYAAQQGEPTWAHIHASRELLALVNGAGFPTLVLERQGRYEFVDIMGYLGQPLAWSRLLSEVSRNDS
ncbi:DsbA family protein [Litchfieldella qijiaojingensis]|uniref:DsbA family protein n=1 Tax=Litchfieldella qijiaojingensis TaxID=980347 RepID=A0ABQ2YMA8_9GAMM|nr:DsbA family protein [Halomonas qijiaojingensis]GGX89140.1 DsbA family protein [Halomonas qijiaojingensis]